MNKKLPTHKTYTLASRYKPALKAKLARVYVFFHRIGTVLNLKRLTFGRRRKAADNIRLKKFKKRGH
jgi:hypothetical protein